MLILSFNLKVAVANASNEGRSECVVLLHGLARTANSMQKLAGVLEKVGYSVVNFDYESRKSSVDFLADNVVPASVAECKSKGAESLHFVTHSLGGILIRYYLAGNTIRELKRVVMLAPPNNGSEVVDGLRGVPGFEWLNGPAGNQLGTGDDSVPKSLGAVNFELGIIAGTRTFNPILSQFLPNPDDGKVSVASARVDGMCWFLTVDESHPFIMKNETVIEQVVEYLAMGKFTSENAEKFDCPALAEKK